MSAHNLASLVAHLVLDCDDLYKYLYPKEEERETLLKSEELERRFGSLNRKEERLLHDGDLNAIFHYIALERGPNRDPAIGAGGGGGGG